MADTSSFDTASQVLNAFIHRKKTRDNTIALQAQRLVNIFRQLSVFKPEFVAEYNKMLLASSDEVRMMMKDIVGGPTVRQYLDYLQAKSENSEEDDFENTEDIQPVNSNTGYLPSPEEDRPFINGFSDSVSSETITDLTQSNLLMQALSAFQEANQKQLEALTETLKEFKKQLSNNTALSKKSETPAITQNDLLQYQLKQQELFEQLIRNQSESLATIVSQLKQQTPRSAGYSASLSQATSEMGQDVADKAEEMILPSEEVSTEKRSSGEEVSMSEKTESSEEKNVSTEMMPAMQEAEIMVTDQAEMLSEVVSSKEEDMSNTSEYISEQISNSSQANELTAFDEKDDFSSDPITIGGAFAKEGTLSEQIKPTDETASVRTEIVQQADSDNVSEVIPQGQGDETALSMLPEELEQIETIESDISLHVPEMPVFSNTEKAEKSVISESSIAFRPVTDESEDHHSEEVSVTEVAIDEKDSLKSDIPPFPQMPPMPNITLPPKGGLPPIPMKGIPTPVSPQSDWGRALLNKGKIPFPMPKSSVSTPAKSQAEKPEQNDIEILSDIELS